MIETDKLDISKLEGLVSYFLQNRHHIQKVIIDFGLPEKENGVGTIFLRPKNDIFKVFWIHQSNDQITSVGMGGPNLGLFVQDLLSYYKNFEEGFERYDDEYIYAFYSEENKTHTIKVRSHEKIIDDARLIANIPVNFIEIVLLSDNL